MSKIIKISDLTSDQPLWLVGCGKMGGALLKGWLNKGLNPKAVTIIDPSAHETCPQEISAAQCYDTVCAIEGEVSPRLVLLAVKPQIIGKVIDSFKSRKFADTMVISVAAGYGMDAIATGSLKGAAIVRAMPNIPAAVGKGMTGMVKNQYVNAADQALAEDVFAACGNWVWLDKEDDLNAVTALSGSGPAYVFYLLEAMAQAGVGLGLSEDVAEQLARQTIIGAAALLAESDKAASVLRENVTSPNGTTAAALEVLMAPDGLAKLMSEAILKASDRSKALSA